MTKIHLASLCALLLSSCQVSFMASPANLNDDLRLFNADCSQAFQRGIAPEEWPYMDMRAKRLSARVHGFVGKYLTRTDRWADHPVFVEFEENCKKLSEFGKRPILSAETQADMTDQKLENQNKKVKTASKKELPNTARDPKSSRRGKGEKKKLKKASSNRVESSRNAEENDDSDFNLADYI